MSSATAIAPTVASERDAVTPRFWGLVRGEVLKLTRHWLTWLLALMVAGTIVLPFLVAPTGERVKFQIAHIPMAYFYQMSEEGLAVLRVFSGIALIILTARLIGLEYSGGTIRVLLSRGVGRLQLLAAKLTVLGLTALTMLVGGIVLIWALVTLLTIWLTGSLDTAKVLGAGFWSDMRLYVLTIAINMVVTILMAAAAAAIGRSLAIGLCIALAFFPVDNVGGELMYLAKTVTGNDFWTNITQWWLGLNLNQMPRSLLPLQGGQEALSIGARPFVEVDARHTLVVVLIYAVVFAATAITLTWRRDVTE